MGSESTIYCFDTNALINFYRFYPPTFVPSLWVELDTLINENRLISHKLVYDELVPKQGADDEIGQWSVDRKNIFIGKTSEQFTFLRDILKNFPKLVDANAKKEQADPYLIAMLIDFTEKQKNAFLKNDYTLVTNENIASTKKLPAACRHYKIRYLSLVEFFIDNGWQLSITK